MEISINSSDRGKCSQLNADEWAGIWVNFINCTQRLKKMNVYQVEALLFTVSDNNFYFNRHHHYFPTLFHRRVLHWICLLHRQLHLPPMIF